MELVFSYGSLQDRSVQLAHFGRELTGHPDGLPGYLRGRFGRHANVQPGSSADVVEGVVFEITEEELATADGYEKGEGYRRIEAQLRSGIRAWVYLAD